MLLISLISREGWLMSFPRFKGKSFKEVVPNLTDRQEELLGKMLCMDPLKRQSSYEILNDKVFDGKTKMNKAFEEIFSD